MGGDLRGIDLKRARLVPSSVFARPDDVVAARISRALKLAILRRWQFDARRHVGFGQGGTAQHAVLLEEVDRALHRLLMGTSKGVDADEPLVQPSAVDGEPMLIEPDAA